MIKTTVSPAVKVSGQSARRSSISTLQVAEWSAVEVEWSAVAVEWSAEECSAVAVADALQPAVWSHAGK